MNILFAGTPEIAVPSLRSAADTPGINVVGVLTNPDRPAGRKRRLQPSPVKTLASELGIPVLQPESLSPSKSGIFEEVRALEPELLVVFAFGRIFRPKFLSLFPRGGINIHPSLLPEFRGPSPINAAILAGVERTGITIQTLAKEMDAGDILAQKSYPLDGSETAEFLTHEMAREGAGLLQEVLANFSVYYDNRTPQDHEKATYCGLLSKEEGQIDFSAPAEKIDRQVRAYNPWPKAVTSFNGTPLYLLETKPLKDALPNGAVNRRKEDREPGTVLEHHKELGYLVQTGDGILCVEKLQLQAKKPLDHKSFANGVQHFTGAQLGS